MAAAVAGDDNRAPLAIFLVGDDARGYTVLCAGTRNVANVEVGTSLVVEVLNFPAFGGAERS
jgi:hypothetical protein